MEDADYITINAGVQVNRLLIRLAMNNRNRLDGCPELGESPNQENIDLFEQEAPEDEGFDELGSAQEFEDNEDQEEIDSSEKEDMEQAVEENADSVDDDQTETQD